MQTFEYQSVEGSLLSLARFLAFYLVFEQLLQTAGKQQVKLKSRSILEYVCKSKLEIDFIVTDTDSDMKRVEHLGQQ